MSDASGKREAAGEDFRRRRRLGRERALQFLYQADVSDAWDCDDEVLSQFWQQVGQLSGEDGGATADLDRAFAERLINGVCCQRGELDCRIEASAHNWSLARMSAVDRNILRLAALQLFHCDDVPDLAAVDEAIEMAKTFGHSDSGRFVNGVLDNLLRQRRQESAG